MPRMGEFAASDSYGPDYGPLPLPDPFEAAAARLRAPYGGVQPRQSALPGAIDAIAGAVVDTVALPGRMIQPNPYEPGTEQWDYYNNSRAAGGERWARDMALNTIGTGLVTGVPTRAGEAVFGAGGVRKTKAKEPTGFEGPPIGEILKPAEAVDTTLAAPYITNPLRVANPGVYKRPDVIAREAAATVAPEHPALKELFGVTRDDLYEISKQGRREGNVTEPNIWMPNKPGAANEAALAAMNPANAQRVLDTLAEARKYPGLERGMVPWYVMDPAYQRMVQLVGPERALKEYRDFNMSMTPFSAGSPVPLEINRGTAARMMWNAGEYQKFKDYGGLAGHLRGADFPPELVDVKGVMGHLNMADPVERYMTTGKHGYGDNSVKINLYSDASGVPEIGFQTRWAVPDAHFTRALGVPDARTNASFNDFMKGPEYRQIGPWYREQIARPLGIEAVPAQALMWGTYGPQTGVKTAIGAGKLELLSQQMWERAKKLGVDPKDFRDKVLRGEEHSFLSPAMGDLADTSRYG